MLNFKNNFSATITTPRPPEGGLPPSSIEEGEVCRRQTGGGYISAETFNILHA